MDGGSQSCPSAGSPLVRRAGGAFRCGCRRSAGEWHRCHCHDCGREWCGGCRASRRGSVHAIRHRSQRQSYRSCSGATRRCVGSGRPDGKISLPLSTKSGRRHDAGGSAGVLIQESKRFSAITVTVVVQRSAAPSSSPDRWVNRNLCRSPRRRRYAGDCDGAGGLKDFARQQEHHDRLAGRWPAIDL